MDSNIEVDDYTCKEAHRIISEALDRDLSPGEVADLRAHLRICIACERVHGQMDLIRRAMRQFPLGDDSLPLPESP